MRTVRVMFKNFWNVDNEKFQAKHFIMRHPYLNGYYDIEDSDSPEVVFFSGFNGPPDLRNVPKEAKKVFYSSEERFSVNIADYDFVFSSQFIDSDKHFRLPHYLSRLYYNGFKPKDLLFKEVGEEVLDRQFCNFVYSNNVEFRNNFCRQLSKYKPVVSAGACLNNAPRIPKGVGYKLDFIKNFKFTIAFENSSYPGNASEKITEPMLVNSIPIYWGSPTIDKDFNIESFINYNPSFSSDTINDIGVLVDYIVELDKRDDLYMKMINKPWYVNNTIPIYADEKKVLEFFGRIFNV